MCLTFEIGSIGGTFVNRYSFRFLPRDHCDAIIFGDAEYSLLNFVSKHNECSNQNDRAILLKNNNLFDESVMDQLKCELNICKHKFPDYSTLDLSVYHKRFKEIYNKDYKIFDLALPCLSVKGYAWRSATGGCVFCAIPHKKKQNICAKMFWENIIRLHNQYGADYFWEVGDSFLDDICWLQEIRNNKPNIDFVYGLEVYARSDQITHETALLMKEIGVYAVFLGLDAPSDRLMKTCEKGRTFVSHENAISLLDEYGIFVIPAFVVGLPDETNQEVLETIELAQKVSTYNNVKEGVVSTLLPIPGSKAFHMMTDKGFYNGTSEKFNADEICSTWISYFTQTNVDMINNALHKISSIFGERVSGSFGLKDLRNGKL